MPFDLIPTEFANAYNLHQKQKGGYIYMEIQKGMYGLPRVSILAKKLLKECLGRVG